MKMLTVYVDENNYKLLLSGKNGFAQTNSSKCNTIEVSLPIESVTIMFDFHDESGFLVKF